MKIAKVIKILATKLEVKLPAGQQALTYSQSYDGLLFGSKYFHVLETPRLRSKSNWESLVRFENCCSQTFNLTKLDCFSPNSKERGNLHSLKVQSWQSLKRIGPGRVNNTFFSRETIRKPCTIISSTTQLGVTLHWSEVGDPDKTNWHVKTWKTFKRTLYCMWHQSRDVWLSWTAPVLLNLPHHIGTKGALQLLSTALEGWLSDIVFQQQDLSPWQTQSSPWTPLYIKVFQSRIWSHPFDSWSLTEIGSCIRTVIPGAAGNQWKERRIDIYFIDPMREVVFTAAAGNKITIHKAKDKNNIHTTVKNQQYQNWQKKKKKRKRI